VSTCRPSSKQAGSKRPNPSYSTSASVGTASSALHHRYDQLSQFLLSLPKKQPPGGDQRDEGGRERKGGEGIDLPTHAQRPQLMIREGQLLTFPPRCFGCSPPGMGRRLHACLHCVFIGCWDGGHLATHLAEHSHTLGALLSPLALLSG